MKGSSIIAWVVALALLKGSPTKRFRKGRQIPRIGRSSRGLVAVIKKKRVMGRMVFQEKSLRSCSHS